MKNNTCSLRFKSICFVLTLLIITFIFVHSSIPSEQSATESQSVLGILQPFFNLFNLDGELAEYILRKLAHFSEFAALGVTLTFCAYSFDRLKTYKFFPHIAGIGLLIAVIDETIQMFVPGRACQITDVWLDFSGVLTGVILMLIIFAIYIRKHKQSETVT